MIKKIALIVFIGVLSLSSKAQDNSEFELVIIRIMEIKTGYTGLSPLIHITENDGSYRVIELEKFSKRYLVEPNDNQKKIHLELKKYLNDGFKIEGHTKGNEGLVVWFEDYILTKKTTP